MLASSTWSGRSSPQRLQDEVVSLLLRTAERISADLGHTSSAPARDGFF